MSSGIILYPPNNSDLSFNYLDTVNVTWNTYAHYATNVNLTLYIQEGSQNTPVPVHQTSVTANGFALVPLNYDDSSTIGHFVISYSGNSTGYGSSDFKIAYNASQAPVTWSLPTQTAARFTAASTPSSSPSSSLSAASQTPTVAQFSDLASPVIGDRPSPGAIVGIVFACLFFLAVVIAVTWAITRIQRRQPLRSHSKSTTSSDRSRGLRLDPEKRGVHELWGGEVARELPAQGIGDQDKRNAFAERSHFSF